MQFRNIQVEKENNKMLNQVVKYKEKSFQENSIIEKLNKSDRKTLNEENINGR